MLNGPCGSGCGWVKNYNDIIEYLFGTSPLMKFQHLNIQNFSSLILITKQFVHRFGRNIFEAPAYGPGARH